MTDPIQVLISKGLTIAVAESLTGGALIARLIDTPGASATVLGGVVAYSTELKHTVLGVPASVLAAHGAVDPDVARAMAAGVRTALAVGGVPADIGISTTGVAGPDAQDGQPVGTVWIGLAVGDRVDAHLVELSGSRADIRSQTVDAAIAILLAGVSE